MTAKGICVFNAPGANANAVKKLVIASMVNGRTQPLSGLKLYPQALGHSDAELSKQVRVRQETVIGIELPNRNLGAIGLGMDWC
jgi:D-3-phosphoglycerate dehydrogenase